MVLFYSTIVGHTIYMDEPKSVGRPSAITKLTVQKLEQALKEGFSIERACHLSGIGRSTFYVNLQSNSKFSDKMLLAQEWATERAKQVIIHELDKGNVKVAQWWLERKARQEFSTNPLPYCKEEAEDSFVIQYFDGDNEKMLDWLESAVKTLRQ